MKCPKCGNEVDTSLFVACPDCRTPLPNASAMHQIGMQDEFGNVLTVGGSLNQPKPQKKINRKTVITIILTIIIINVIFTVGYFVIRANTPRTYEEAIEIAKENAQSVVNQQLRYHNLNTWYANNCVADDGEHKFIIYCDVYGALSSGGYGRIQMYVGIELKDKSDDYVYWSSGNIYPYGDNRDYYIQQLKTSMNW